MATCKNGHYYPDDKEQCPYCPRQTQQTNSGSDDLLRTQVGTPFDTPAAPRLPTDNTRVEMPRMPSTPLSPALKTQIEPDPLSAADTEADRRLMGWLVTFDEDPSGTDYRLREGRNVIGSGPDCDLVLSGDPGISGKHLTILFRLGEILYKDELSTNGTWINGKLSNEGNLQDGSTIRLGNRQFLFRSAHPKQETL